MNRLIDVDHHTTRSFGASALLRSSGIFALNRSALTPGESDSRRCDPNTRHLDVDRRNANAWRPDGRQLDVDIGNCWNLDPWYHDATPNLRLIRGARETGCFSRCDLERLLRPVTDHRQRNRTFLLTIDGARDVAW